MIENVARVAWEKGYRKAANLHPNDAAGVQLVAVAKELWEKWGGKIVATETAPLGATDFTFT
jgi:outer membrane PBP1 activator LpoA protein